MNAVFPPDRIFWQLSSFSPPFWYFGSTPRIPAFKFDVHVNRMHARAYLHMSIHYTAKAKKKKLYNIDTELGKKPEHL